MHRRSDTIQAQGRLVGWKQGGASVDCAAPPPSPLRAPPPFFTPSRACVVLPQVIAMSAPVPVPDIDVVPIDWQPAVECAGVEARDGVPTRYRCIVTSETPGPDGTTPVLVLIRRIATCIMGKIYVAHKGDRAADGSIIISKTGVCVCIRVQASRSVPLLSPPLRTSVLLFFCSQLHAGEWRAFVFVCLVGGVRCVWCGCVCLFALYPLPCTHLVFFAERYAVKILEEVCECF